MSNQQRIDAFIKFGEMAENYGDQYASKEVEECYPANQQRLSITLSLLKKIKPKRILDVGCGSGEPMIAFLREGFDVNGFDYAEEMVIQAQHNLASAGYPPELVHRNNIEDIKETEPGTFDCIVALGSIYYARDFAKAMLNVTDLLPETGHAIFSLRNDLFSLFSVNKYTMNFFLKYLIPVGELSQHTSALLTKYLDSHFMEDKTERRFNTVDDLNIHSVYHNPLTIQEDVLKPYGLALEGLYFYHYHALPPIFEHIVPAEFRRVSFKIEKPADWRGLFMSSAFLVHAVKRKGPVR